MLKMVLVLVSVSCLCLFAAAETKKNVTKKDYKGVVVIAEVESVDNPLKLEFKLDKKLEKVQGVKNKALYTGKKHELSLRDSNMFCFTSFVKNSEELSVVLQCSNATKDFSGKNDFSTTTLVEIKSDCDASDNVRDLKLASSNVYTKKKSNYYIFISCQSVED